MSEPKSTQELAEQIEALVTQYVAEGRRAAQQAVERAFSLPTNEPSRPIKIKTAEPKTKGARARRRSAEEVEALSERLYELIRARPGETMVLLAAALGMKVRELERPIVRLKRASRIRGVGDRQHMRYFPRLGGKAEGLGA
jgi:hypothetical protein